MSARTPWSTLPETFLSEGDWAIGQGPDAPDRQLFRALLRGYSRRPFDLLEVGMGPGIDLAGIEADPGLDGIVYCGYDLTPELVKFCAEEWPQHQFAVKDMVTMDDTAVADVVYTRHTLEHVTDGEAALRNLWAATNSLLIISWFIRPTWCDADVGCVEADGFLHHTYSAWRWIPLVCSELGAHLYRFDIDHHLNRGSVWLLARESQPELAEVAHNALAWPIVLNATIPVPPDPRERETALLDILEDAHESLGKVIPAVPRVTDMLLVLQEAREELERAVAVLDLHLDDDNAVDAAQRARTTLERVKAALGDHDPDAEAAAQAARDAQARIESSLIENGRLGG